MFLDIKPDHINSAYIWLMKLKICGVQAALQVTSNMSPQLFVVRTEDLRSPRPSLNLNRLHFCGA